MIRARRTLVPGILVATAIAFGACGDRDGDVKLDKQGQDLMERGQQLKKDARELETSIEQPPEAPAEIKDLPGQDGER